MSDRRKTVPALVVVLLLMSYLVAWADPGVAVALLIPVLTVGFVIFDRVVDPYVERQYRPRA